MLYKWGTGIENDVYKDALNIRKKVFVEEQNVSLEEELDGKDQKALHVVLYVEEKATATARLLLLENKTYVIQRFAVLMKYRRQGLGEKLLSEIIKKVREKNGEYITLNAQDHAIPFYEKSGFEVEGEGFLDANIPHHTMSYKVNT